MGAFTTLIIGFTLTQSEIEYLLLLGLLSKEDGRVNNSDHKNLRVISPCCSQIHEVVFGYTIGRNRWEVSSCEPTEKEVPDFQQIQCNIIDEWKELTGRPLNIDDLKLLEYEWYCRCS
mmetsp:Transcript_7638/g.9472  ORF Transcript_7638/g.9472 Transcript_7638/m.9472 type:complete len:118 (+) Transcript_7638:1414-1767(+)